MVEDIKILKSVLYFFCSTTILWLCNGQKVYDEIQFGNGGKTKMMFGSPSQELYLQLRLEDEYIYLIPQECVQQNKCFLNDSNNYFVPSQSSSFSTQLKIFDGSVTNRPYPVGIWAEDNVQVSSLAQKLQFGLAEKCPFVVQGNGVFGLRFSQKPENHINILLRQFKYPIIGIGLTVGYSDAFPYNGELVLGGGSKKCQREYQYAQVNTVKYDSWIFDVQRVVFGQVTFTQDTPVTLAIGQRYTVFPLELFNKIVVELDARQADSQTQTYYVRYQGVKFPTIGFESYGVLLTMYPKDYLGKLTPYGYELLIRPKIDWAIPNDQIILGDNFLTAYCILLEYTVPPKIGFSMSECIPVVPNMIFLGFLVLLKVLVE